MDISKVMAMDDNALTAYLFGMAVACPLGVARKACPMFASEATGLDADYHHLRQLPRQEKLRLASLHLGCSARLTG